MTARRRLDQQLFSHMILESIGERFIVRWSTEYVEHRLCRLLHGPVDLSHLMQVYRVIAPLYVRIALLVPFPEQVRNNIPKYLTLLSSHKYLKN